MWPSAGAEDGPPPDFASPHPPSSSQGTLPAPLAAPSLLAKVSVPCFGDGGDDSLGEAGGSGGIIRRREKDSTVEVGFGSLSNQWRELCADEIVNTFELLPNITVRATHHISGS